MVIIAHMSVESEAKKVLRNTRIRQAILSTLAVGGLMTVAVVLPGAMRYLKKPLSRSGLTSGRSAVGRLATEGLVTFEEKSGKSFLRITPKGTQHLHAWVESSRKPLRWDRQWRIVIFDVAERNRALRNRLRETLIRIGFFRLQHSVWVYPYDCEEIIALLKTHIEVGGGVLYIVAAQIENDRPIRRHFGLK